MADQVFSAKAGFFDSQNHDRVYTASDMTKPYQRLIADGVYPTPDGDNTGLAVSAVSGMTISVSAGAAMMLGKWYELAADQQIVVPANSSAYGRIDSVIIRMDTRQQTRAGNLIYRTGEPSVIPSAPALASTAGVKELRIANITVAASASSISSANIADQRGTTDGPWVRSLFAEINAQLENVSLASEMTDTSKSYAYIGNEEGYSFGHWYYWDGEAWADGGLYPTMNIDSAFDLESTNAVENKVVSAAVDEMSNEIEGMMLAVYNSEEVASPFSVPSTCLIRAEVGESGYVVTGTRNKALLYPFQQGTFVVNDVTFVIEKNVIKIDGTPSKSFYFSFQKMDEVTNAEMAAEPLDLPSGMSWYFSIKPFTGYASSPGLYFRKKDNSGTTSLTHTPTVFDPSIYGGLGIYMQNGTEYHRGCYFCICDTNTTSFIETLSERVRWLEETTTVVAKEGDYIIADASSELTALTPKAEKKTPRFIYSTRAVANVNCTEVVDVYIPMKTGYIDYVFCHTVSAITEAQGGGNVWRLGYVTKVDDSLAYQYNITTSGETEMAIHIEDRDDFIGGTTHGDEWINDGSFFAALNGKPVDISDYTDLTEFETLDFWETTTLHDPADHTATVGTHGMQITFSKEGMEIRQSVSFAGSYNMIGSYLTMVCAIRNSYGAQTLQITDTYFDDNTFQKWDVSEPGFTTYPNQLKQGLKEVVLYGEDYGVQVKVEYIDQPEGLIGEGNYVLNNVAYNKIYNAICGYNNQVQTVDSSTVWKTRSKIQILAD